MAATLHRAALSLLAIIAVSGALACGGVAESTTHSDSTDATGVGGANGPGPSGVAGGGTGAGGSAAGPSTGVETGGAGGLPPEDEPWDNSSAYDFSVNATFRGTAFDFYAFAEFDPSPNCLRSEIGSCWATVCDEELTTAFVENPPLTSAMSISLAVSGTERSFEYVPPSQYGPHDGISGALLAPPDGEITIVGVGDEGEFSSSVPIPDAVELHDAPTSVSTASDWELSWTPAGAGTEVVVYWYGAKSLFRCDFDATTGTGVVPVEFLALAPPADSLTLFTANEPRMQAGDMVVRLFVAQEHTRMPLK